MTTKTAPTPGHIRIYPYNQASESAAALSQQMTIDGRAGVVPRLRREGSTYKGSRSHVVINWGSSAALPDACYRGRVVNTPETVALATNKLTFFQACAALVDGGPRIPDWTTDKNEVVGWLDSGRTAFARTVLNGNSGAGIVDVTSPDQLTTIRDGTLFVKYIPKKEEWRIHVGFGNPFEIQRKAYRTTGINTEGFTPNWRIRNHNNGFIFERNFPTPPHQDILDQAVRAVTSLGLDFGAVDVIWNAKRSEAYVLEVNTAPGIEGTTVTSYKDMFLNNLGKTL